MNYVKATRQELQKHCRGLEKEIVRLRKEAKQAEGFTVLANSQKELVDHIKDLEDENSELKSRVDQLIKSRDYINIQLNSVKEDNKIKSDEYAKYAELSYNYSKLESRKHRAVGKLVVSITVNVILAVSLLYCLI